MSETGRIMGYFGLGVAGLMLGLALTMIAVRGARHVAWALERRRDRLGRRGDLLEDLAQKIEGRSL